MVGAVDVIRVKVRVIAGEVTIRGQMDDTIDPFHDFCRHVFVGDIAANDLEPRRVELRKPTFG